MGDEVCDICVIILINRAPMEPFKAKKGLRKGDPLSPYLFAICMEYLSRILGRGFERAQGNQFSSKVQNGWNYTPSLC